MSKNLDGILIPITHCPNTREGHLAHYWMHGMNLSVCYGNAEPDCLCLTCEDGIDRPVSADRPCPVHPHREAL